jgi:hypothetical protein
MFRQVVIEAGREGVTKCPHPGIETTVFFTSQPGNLERPVPAIILKPLFAVKFRGAAKSRDEILFNAPEVIFGLGIGKTENGARIGSAKNMRHAIPIAIDSDHPRELLSIN